MYFIALGILALKDNGEGMHLRRHQSSGNRRIRFHESARCGFVGRFEDGNPKRLVARLHRPPGENELSRLNCLLKPRQVSPEHSLIVLRPGGI